MRRLVALDLPASTLFVTALRNCIDRGDAIMPIDQRLPGPARKRLLEAFAPASVIGKDGAEQSLSGGIPTETGDAIVIATSGSTGEPKGVVLTLDAVISSALATSERLGVDRKTDRWLACLPVGHIGGLSVILRAVYSDTDLEVHAQFDATAVIEAARARGASLVSLVPTAMARLGTDIHAFRRVVLGGSAMPPELPDNAVCTYGMTETGSGVVYDGLALSGVEVRVEHGEIALRAPMLLRAYRDGRDPKDEDGWLWTGDAGSLADGVLSVQGRIADMIITGGENIWPEAVEAVLAGHPSLVEVGVFGAPDKEWGERVCAAVVVAQDEPVPDLSELRALVRAEIGGFAAPRELLVLDALPRTALGKLRRNELSALADSSRAP